VTADFGWDSRQPVCKNRFWTGFLGEFKLRIGFPGPENPLELVFEEFGAPKFFGQNFGGGKF